MTKLGILAILVVVCGLWFVMGYGPSHGLVGWGRGFESLERAGQFGDSFGFVNSLFTALGVVGVALALGLQAHELREGRAEQAETERKHIEIRDAMVMQADALFLANYLDIRRRINEYRGQQESLKRDQRAASDDYLIQRQIGDIEKLVQPLEQNLSIFQPHAERIMARMAEQGRKL